MQLMQNRRVQVGLLVIVFAGLVGYYFLVIVPRKEAEKPAPTRLFRVEAATFIPRQTVVTDAMVRQIELRGAQIPVDGILPEEWVQDPKEVVGFIAAEDIPGGAALERSMLAGKADAQGIAALIPFGLRAMVVRITRDEPQTVHDLVRIGDRVDIIASFRTSGYTRTLIENVPVLAVDVFTNEGQSIAQRGPNVPGAEKTDAPSKQDKTAATMTLGVTPEQAEIIALADRAADLDFTVRGKNESPSSSPSMAAVGGIAVSSLLPASGGGRTGVKAHPRPHAGEQGGRAVVRRERARPRPLPEVVDDNAMSALSLTEQAVGNKAGSDASWKENRLIEVFAPRSRHFVVVPDRSKS